MYADHYTVLWGPRCGRTGRKRRQLSGGSSRSQDFRGVFGAALVKNAGKTVLESFCLHAQTWQRKNIYIYIHTSVTQMTNQEPHDTSHAGPSTAKMSRTRPQGPAHVRIGSGTLRAFRPSGEFVVRKGHFHTNMPNSSLPPRPNVMYNHIPHALRDLY